MYSTKPIFIRVTRYHEYGKKNKNCEFHGPYTRSTLKCGGQNHEKNGDFYLKFFPFSLKLKSWNLWPCVIRVIGLGWRHGSYNYTVMSENRTILYKALHNSCTIWSKNYRSHVLKFRISLQYTGKYSPLFHFCHFHSCQWAKLNLSETVLFSFNRTSCAWANSKRGKTVCMCRKVKITGDKNNSVYRPRGSTF